MTKKKTIKIVAIVLTVAILLGTVFALIPFMIRDKTEFDFYASGLSNEASLYPQSHDGRTFYVAADGGDWHNDGSIEKPYSLDYIRWFTRTNYDGNNPISKREIDEPFFKPGDQILLKRGDVFKTNLEINYCHGDEDNPITIASYGRQRFWRRISRNIKHWKCCWRHLAQVFKYCCAGFGNSHEVEIKAYNRKGLRGNICRI